MGRGYDSLKCPWLKSACQCLLHPRNLYEPTCSLTIGNGPPPPILFTVGNEPHLLLTHKTSITELRYCENFSYEWCCVYFWDSSLIVAYLFRSRGFFLANGNMVSEASHITLWLCRKKICLSVVSFCNLFFQMLTKFKRSEE